MATLLTLRDSEVWGMCEQMGNVNERHTILLVDDDDEVRSALGRGLKRAGFRVVAAFDELDGVERGAHERPDLILVELGRVPQGEALAAGGRVRAGAGIPEDVPVVVYANSAGEMAREGEAVEVGPAEHVVLPEDAEQLIGWLRRLAASLVAAALSAAPLLTG